MQNTQKILATLLGLRYNKLLRYFRKAKMITAKQARIKAHEKTDAGRAILKQREDLELAINQKIAKGELSLNLKDAEVKKLIADKLHDDNVLYIVELGFMIDKDRTEVRW